MSEHVKWQHTDISRTMREGLIKQQGCVLWFTGLSGSGKSTIASELERALHNMGKLTYMLDGDNIRHGINTDLGFSKHDRDENIRRISEIAALFEDCGIITIVSFISPYIEMRCRAREKASNFIEIFVDTDLEVCISRDTKGLYEKAHKGEINDFTGIDDPYERPISPEITIKTPDIEIADAVKMIIEFMKKRTLLN